jgi:hypothetical protein
MLIKRSDSESDSFSSNDNGDKGVERDTVGYDPTFIDGWTARGGDRESSSANSFSLRSDIQLEDSAKLMTGANGYRNRIANKNELKSDEVIGTAMSYGHTFHEGKPIFDRQSKHPSGVSANPPVPEYALSRNEDDMMIGKKRYYSQRQI